MGRVLSGANTLTLILSQREGEFPPTADYGLRFHLFSGTVPSR